MRKKPNIAMWIFMGMTFLVIILCEVFMLLSDEDNKAKITFSIIVIGGVIVQALVLYNFWRKK